jgi:hypothetical protein
MPNDKDDLKPFPTSQQGSRDAGRYEAGKYDKPAPKQSWESDAAAGIRQNEFDKTRNGG